MLQTQLQALAGPLAAFGWLFRCYQKQAGTELCQAQFSPGLASQLTWVLASLLPNQPTEAESEAKLDKIGKSVSGMKIHLFQKDDDQQIKIIQTKLM